MESVVRRNMRKNPTTTLAASFLCLASFASLWHQNGIFGAILLAHIWFLNNALAAGICAMKHGMDSVPPILNSMSEKVNFFCGGVSMPFLTSYFLFVDGWKFLGLIFLAAGIIMGLLICIPDVLPELDRQTIVGYCTILSTFLATGICYLNNNISGTSGGVCLILANVILASDKNMGDFSPFDIYLLVLAASNYFYGYSTY